MSSIGSLAHRSGSTCQSRHSTCSRRKRRQVREVGHMKVWISAFAAAALVAAPASAQTINVATAGDQNMVDYVKDYLGPMFEKANPGTKVVAVGTGPGDAGSQ